MDPVRGRMTAFRRPVRLSLELAAVFALAACGRAPDEPEGIVQQQLAAPAELGTVPAAAREFRFEARAAVIKFGGGLQSRREMGFIKQVGAWATHATDEVNGSVMVVPNADAPSMKAKPFGKSLGEHGQRVRELFVNAGLPAEEIHEISGVTGGTGEASLDEPAGRRVGAPVYYSVVHRAVAGTRVADSYAWARVADDGEVVEAAVYWPKIPGRVIADAVSMRGTLGSASTKAAYLAKIPSSRSEGAVVIRHSAATDHGAFEASAVYDTTDRKGAVAMTRHFGIDAKELSLPSERVGPAAQGNK
jgi:hypothetical protein